MGDARMAVIGSGFGGLAAGIRLQAAGVRTVMYEARDRAGGRAYVYQDQGFTFDAGPTVIKQASAVVQVDAGGYRLLRAGMITHEMIHQLLVGKNILFVCSGNSCRSPMAEALFKKLLAQKLGYEPDDLGELGYTIHSAGTFALGGGWASQNAVKVMEDMGCDIGRHIARPVTATMVQEADRIYCMSPSHLRQLVEWNPGIESKILLLREDGISDPIGGDLEAYRTCAHEIEAAIQDILKGF